MADEKKEAPNPLQEDFEKIKNFLWIAGVIIVIIIGLLFKVGTDSDGFLNIPPSGDISAGDSIATKKEAQVRTEPGGAILGTQDKRVFGTVVDGPESFGGRVWWRINYPDAPDGWVEEAKITNIFWLFYLINIVPYATAILLPVSIVICIILIVLLVYVRASAAGIPAVNSVEEQEFLARTNRVQLMRQTDPSDAATQAAAYKPNERWVSIERMVDSMNVNDWRQAIIEADIILEEMLDKIGYDGMTVADKLKNVEPSDFRTLNEAWQAHKVRNRVAHDGSAFQLDHNQAKRVIGLYRQVFEEFYYI